MMEDIPLSKLETASLTRLFFLGSWSSLAG